MDSEEHRLHQQNMKTYKDLSKKIFTLENFRKAYKNAIKGKKHYKEVKLIECRGPIKYLRELLKEVVDKTYEVTKLLAIFEYLKVGPVSIIPLYLSAQNLAIEAISFVTS